MEKSRILHVTIKPASDVKSIIDGSPNLKVAVVGHDYIGPIKSMTEQIYAAHPEIDVVFFENKGVTR